MSTPTDSRELTSTAGYPRDMRGHGRDVPHARWPNGARHFTPFFIRNRGGHGDYWLIHMSQHHRARDVMTEVHWANNNYFIHYGGAGLDMFQMVGYDPVHDASYLQQSPLGFEFDDVAQGGLPINWSLP